MKLIYKINLPIFVVILSIIIFIGLFSQREFKKAVFQENYLSTLEKVFKKAPQFLKAEDFKDFNAPEAKKVFGDFAEEITNSATARFTLWNLDEVIAFSDLRSLIGQKSQYNPDLKRAISEKSPFFNVKSEDNARPTQSSVGEFLDIYVPIELSGELVGILEIHAVSAAVLQPLEMTLDNIVYILILGGLVEFAAVLAVTRFFVTKPLKKLEDEILEIKRGGGRK